MKVFTTLWAKKLIAFVNKLSSHPFIRIIKSLTANYIMFKKIKFNVWTEKNVLPG